ncbi:MAG: lysophospholipid acyltransferase family protein [Bacteroidales bacterium]|jgi:KDO2-lipid IV(A) lauroyltransferase|nr:lysophospholipid acyltransferase family protein [Bacteroidales bacterium]
MGAVIYHITYVLIRFITLFPLGMLYGLSYPLFFVLYVFPGYRRKVTRTNLLNSFPGKSIGEIRKIERRFYMHLSDIFIESLKSLHMTESEFRKRYVILNPELPLSIIDSGRDVLIIGAHYNNWEWFISMPMSVPVKTITVYKPLKDRRFDKMMYRMRSRFGMILSPMSHIVRDIISCRKKGGNLIAAFIADQTPPRGDIKFWTTFLNQDTPVYLGPEKISSRFGMKVLFINVKKIKRGKYEVLFEELPEEPGSKNEHAVTEAHTRRLEEIIREKPEYWLWTHRRWKHRRTNTDG